MTSNVVTPEVIEIGEVEALILGAKPEPGIEENGEVSLPDGDLDD